MKNLPNKKILRELLQLSDNAEDSLKTLCDLTAKVDEKWRIKLESRKEIAKPFQADN